jgi:putative PIG3 family NAD(P)H quinone oxidoreductase
MPAMSAVGPSARMRAVVVPSPGGPGVLTLADVERPAPKADEVLVRVRAAALNHADLLQRAGEFPAPRGESEVLGVEIAGDVVACGADARLARGAAVFGLVGGGGYAEYCVLDAEMAIPIPPGFSYAEAAALPEVFFTADTTIFRLGKLKRNQSVLVHGGGSGLGTACIQMAKSIGARVACTVGSDAKASRVRELGADLALNYRRQDFVREVLGWTDGKGVDLVEDIVGADYFERNLTVLKEGGCLVQVGVISGTLCAIDLDLLVLKRLQIRGSIMRPRPMDAKRAIARRFRARWLPLLTARKLIPVIDSIYPITDVARAHEALACGEHVGKIVLDLDHGTRSNNDQDQYRPNQELADRP